MEALMASYADSGSDSDSDHPLDQSTSISEPSSITPLPPPPLSLLTPPNSLGTLDYLQTSQANRIRTFAHVDGNYALHIYIPVHVPFGSKEKLAQFIQKVSSFVSGLHVVDADIPLSDLLKSKSKFEEIALGREFHISLGRTVPLRVHQIESVVSMLRQKLQSWRRYLINFDKWDVFVNDDRTHTFLSIEVMKGGLTEMTRQIQAVNEVYKLHNLPEFYKDPRPHISIAWALGDISESLKRVVELEKKSCASIGESSLFTFHIPSGSKEKLAWFMQKVASLLPGLHVADADIPLDDLLKNKSKFREITFGREFHISLEEQFHYEFTKIESVVSMLRQKL